MTRATELIPGRTYRTDSGREVTFAQVLGPTRRGEWFALDDAGYLHGAFDATNMPTEVQPVAPWVITLEWRAPEVGDTVIDADGVWVILVRREMPHWVLVVTPNPEYTGGDQ